jgi:hypothetical protein
MPVRPLLICVLALASGCGPEGPHLAWSKDVSSLDNPFPDARFLQTSGGAKFRDGWYKPFLPPKAQSGRMRAFLDAQGKQAETEIFGIGNLAPVLLKGTVAFDKASLAGHFARVEVEGDAVTVLERELVAEHSTKTLESPGYDAPSDFPDFVLVRAQRPVREGKKGFLVALKGIKAADGTAFERGREWEADASRPALAPLAKALGVAESDILLALPLSPAGISAELDKLAAWAEQSSSRAQVVIPNKGFVAAGVGMRPVGRWSSTDSDWSVLQPFLEKQMYGTPASAVGQVVIGEILSKDLRQSGVWNKDWVADPSSAPTVALPFVLTVPRGTRPAGGWPTVIGAHGLGGRNLPVQGDIDGYCLEQAQILAVQGIACIGIDGTSHGLRGNSFDFLNVNNMPEVRDNFREMSFDLMQLTRAAPQIDVDGDGQGDLDADFGYLGNSLGAIMGAHFLTYAKHVSYFALNVPGGGLSNILVSEDIRDRLGLLIVAQTGLTFDSVEYYGAFPLFRAAVQSFLEPGDNLNAAYRLDDTKAVLLQEGVNDLTIPNFTTENLATEARIGVPTSTQTGTTPQQGLTRWDAARFLSPAQAANYNGHNVFGSFAPVRDQAVRFLKSRGRELVVE